MVEPKYLNGSTALTLLIKKHWLDLLWLILMGFVLAHGISLSRSGWLCDYMGVDFRGYYASALIARQYGFAQVYDGEIQREVQSGLLYRCADVHQPPVVAMPYLPVFILFFLPLTIFDFTVSYYLWVLLNIILLVVYLWRYSSYLSGGLNFIRLMQWGICIPVISNLFLGQTNVWLLICVGEFTRSFLRDRLMLSGLWLGGMLLKPQTLILILPALILKKRWKVFLGVFLVSLLLLGVSFIMVGVQGLVANAVLVYKFAGPLIETAPYMMNIRALVLNLQQHLSTGLLWLLGITAGCLVILTVLRLWQQNDCTSSTHIVLLFLATFVGAFMVTWHSHFYLLICLIPFLIYLDAKKVLPLSIQISWFLAPFIFYGIVSFMLPQLSRNMFGLGMLALNLLLLVWTGYMLSYANWKAEENEAEIRKLTIKNPE